MSFHLCICITAGLLKSNTTLVAHHICFDDNFLQEMTSLKLEQDITSSVPPCPYQAVSLSSSSLSSSEISTQSTDEAVASSTRSQVTQLDDVSLRNQQYQHDTADQNPHVDQAKPPPLSSSSSSSSSSPLPPTTATFDRATWKQSRVKSLESVRNILENAKSSQQQQQQEQQDKRMMYVLIIDDNMFYRSMRRPFFQLARSYHFGFVRLCHLNLQ